jgi:hypothetical protein
MARESADLIQVREQTPYHAASLVCGRDRFLKSMCTTDPPGTARIGSFQKWLGNSEEILRFLFSIRVRENTIFTNIFIGRYHALVGFNKLNDTRTGSVRIAAIHTGSCGY